LAGGLYDHLLAVVLVGAVFVGSVVALPNVGYVGFLSVDQQQLRNVALTALNTMLLDAGYPLNWGASAFWPNGTFNQNAVVRFGLASADDSTFYVLDSDKVQRLVTDSSLGSISTNRVRSLLGLQGYKFSLRIIPPFNVTLYKGRFELNPSMVRLEFDVKVSHNDKRPIAGASVQATIVYTTKKGTSAKFYTVIERATTDAVGKCQIAKDITAGGGEEITDAVVIFKVTVADLSSVVLIYQSTPLEDIANVNVVGDNITLTIPDSPPSPPNDARWVDNIVVLNEDSFTFLYNGTRSNDDKLTYGKGYQVWNQNMPGLSYSDASFFLFSFWVVVEGGRRSTLVAGPNPNWLGSRVLQFGDTVVSGGSALTVQRDVIISGMTYVAEFTLWKQ